MAAAAPGSSRVFPTLVLSCLFVATPAARADGPPVTTQPEPYSLPAEAVIEIFGREESAPIRTGFLFIDGKYERLPYVVRRVGMEIHVNGCLVDGRNARSWPREDLRVAEDPGIPPGLTPDSGLSDLRLPNGDAWDLRKRRWLMGTVDQERGHVELIQYYLSLPFVAEATIAANKRSVRVVTKKGDVFERRLPNEWEPFLPPVSAEAVQKGLKVKYEYYCDVVGKGAVFLFTSGGEWRFSEDYLPEAVEIWSSAASPEEKHRRLQALTLAGTRPYAPGLMSAAVTAGFRPDEELTARCAEIRARRPKDWGARVAADAAAQADRSRVLQARRALTQAEGAGGQQSRHPWLVYADGFASERKLSDREALAAKSIATDLIRTQSQFRRSRLAVAMPPRRPATMPASQAATSPDTGMTADMVLSHLDPVRDAALIRDLTAKDAELFAELKKQLAGLEGAASAPASRPAGSSH